MRTYPVVEFPAVGKTTGATTQLPEAALGEAVRQVVRAASHDDARPLLTGVLLSRVNGSIRMVATDSYRMAMRDLPGISALPGEEDLLVPARALIVTPGCAPFGPMSIWTMSSRASTK